MTLTVGEIKDFITTRKKDLTAEMNGITKALRPVPDDKKTLDQIFGQFTEANKILKFIKSSMN